MENRLMPQPVEAIRRFNRFYTKQIGLLQASLLGSGFSLTEARIIFEIAHRRETTASELSSELGVDNGYLSRIIRDFEKRDLVEKRQSQSDGRQRLLRLTGKGKEAFGGLDSRARDQVAAMIDELSQDDREQLLGAMCTIEELLGPSTSTPSHYVLRPHQPGDIGWVIHRHGVLYSQEFGWDDTFEALVAGILADFVNNFDPKSERAWLAEIDGEIVGSVFVTRRTKAEANLRLLLVEPKARGMGIGTRLVDECIRFATRVGYKTLSLWTNDVLHTARRIYERAGFQLIEEKGHHSFGCDLVGQTWELKL